MTNLDKKQTAELKKRLQDRFDHLREDIRKELLRADEQHYIDLAGQVYDIGESSVANLLADLDLAGIDREIKEIRAIEAALQRVNMGSYDTCADCGGSIGYERLRSYPTAERCIACQDRHEKSYAHEGTPRF